MVAQHGVVEGGQEPRRRGDVVGRQRRVRQVEQLATALVAVGDQGRSQPGDGGRQPGEPGPRADVGRGGRAERREVPQHQRVERVVGRRRELLAEPGPERRARRGALLPPRPARRHLHDGDDRAEQVGDVARQDLGPAAGDLAGDVRQRARAGVEQRLGGGPQLVLVDPGQPGAQHAPRPLAHHRLVQRLPGQRVGRRHQVHGAAHQPGAHQRPLLQQPARALRVGVGEPGVQPRYGSCGSCACSPATWATASAGPSGERSSSSCRARVARPSSRRRQHPGGHAGGRLSRAGRARPGRTCSAGRRVRTRARSR